MKFRIEELVPPSQVQVAKLFECPICLGVLHDPVQTKCEHIFCEECINQARNGVCPLCKTLNDDADVKPLKDVNMPMYRLMGNIPVVCPYQDVPQRKESQSSGKKPRTERMCTWSGTYADLLEVHLEVCSCAPVQCKYCSAEVKRIDLASHEDGCENRFAPCEICGERVRPGDDHAQTAALIHVAILQSKLQNAEVDVQSRVGQIRDQLAKLQSEVAKCAKTSHVTQKINEVKHIPFIGEKFVFKINGVKKLVQDYLVGREWMSPLSQAMPFRISIYPNGDEESNPGHYAFYVEAVNTHPSVKYDLTAEVGTDGGHVLVGADASYGDKSWGLTSQLCDDAVDDVLTVTLTIDEVSREYSCAV
mmetsp:Transcript_42933/g.118746  ORF Transcript_42933/g.118746 Transcript_42933/m.118746 type:complete len:362 (-) Transcript_42933:103-1188(-)